MGSNLARRQIIGNIHARNLVGRSDLEYATVAEEIPNFVQVNIEEFGSDDLYFDLEFS
jgi:hypothetical protein